MARFFLFLWLGIGLLLGACGAVDDRFRTRTGGAGAVKYHSPVHMKATGVGCALNESIALRLSRKSAQFNLRSLIGGERYLVSYREVDRYQEGGQTCIESEAESRDP